MHDIPAMAGLLTELFTLETDFNPDPTRQSEGLRLLLEDANCVVWVADNDNAVVGMCTVQILISTAEGGRVGLVEDVIIKHDFRGQGIGRGLMQEVIRWTQAHNLLRLQLLVDMQNDAAKQFYEKLGWQPTQLQGMRRVLNYAR